jgi:hypothetical protein
MGLTGLFLLAALATTGCGNKEQKANIPAKEIELPKQGPMPAGGAAPGPEKNSSSQ